MEIRALADYADQLLDPEKGKDYCPNGLQVEGTRPVRRIVTGVSACVELFERAAAAGADVVLVHHGLIWESTGTTPMVGHHGRRLRTLFASGMHLMAYHLPLDRHGELGNNALAVKGLGLYSVEAFGLYAGRPIGFRGRYPEPIAPDELVSRCRKLFGQEPLAFLAGPERISTLGMISGGAPGELLQAIDARLDAYVTGEPTEWVMNVARDAGIHFLACGHHATERLGVRALGEHLATRFALEHEFIDVPNPI